MAITQTLCTSFKVNVFCGVFNFGTGTPQVFKAALYESTASLSEDTTEYTTTGEITGTGYTAGGETVTVTTVPTSSGRTAYFSFSNPSWPASTLTARGALIYLANGTTNPSICVLDFGADKSTSNQTFTVQMPPVDATNAIVRFK